MSWRRPDREDRQVAVLWAACAASAVLLRPVFLAAAGFLPGCVWRAWTGWPCPGCGSTRAIVKLFDADPAGAIAFNPLVAGAAIVFLVGGFVAPVWLACGGLRPHVTSRFRPAWLAAAALAVVANWAWLFASGV